MTSRTAIVQGEPDDSASLRFKPRAGRRYHDRAHTLIQSDNLEVYLALRRRGFNRVATTSTCRIPRRQHAVGLITRQNSLRGNEASLAEISPFLCTSAAIAVLIDSRESATCLKIRAKLEQMGFRIQAGVRCQQGLVLSAYRQSFSQMENAA